MPQLVPIAKTTAPMTDMSDADTSRNIQTHVTSVSQTETSRKSKLHHHRFEDDASLIDESNASLPWLEEKQKREEIQNACKLRDVISLSRLASTTGGLLNDEVRCEACMFIGSSMCHENKTKSPSALQGLY